MIKAKELFLTKDAGFINQMGRAFKGASKLNVKKGLKYDAALGTHLKAGTRAFSRYAVKHPIKTATGALAGYGGYKLVTD